MTYFSAIYKLSLVAAVCFMEADCSRCPVLECWFVQEKAGRGGGLTPAVNQEKSLLHIGTSAPSGSPRAPSDINPDKVFFVTGEFRGTR
ncbi:unnamed protein product [Tetraodon nigroviridis]|uniref:(spotted green pufferfish) hypothetical protein n=1 Tax=Tetraodon nigroviridis TaxID=99883 RepID=Q4TDT2_TETNG|nr:unnamed protein product [Tetraodon nigroviridis]